MTNESVTTKKAPKKGYPARFVGGLLMVLGIVMSIAAGSFTAIAAILFFAGLVALIVGIAQRDTEKS